MRRVKEWATRVWAVSLTILVLVAGLVAIGVWGWPGRPGSAAPKLGLFVARENSAAITALGATLKVTVQMMTVYADGPAWTTYSDPPATSLQLLLGVGEVTPGEARTIGHRLVSTGHANTIIRIMWEMNGNSFPWGVQALSAAKYIAVYRAAERAFAAVPGNHFQYVWNLNAGSVAPGRTEFDTYPGNAYVSNIGIDFYDFHDDSVVPPILAFAAAQGKPVSFDEWGLNGRDDPAFINYVASVVNDPGDNVDFQAYFSDGRSKITRFPRSEAAYTSDFARGKS